jgi:hypothetical protein
LFLLRYCLRQKYALWLSLLLKEYL